MIKVSILYANTRWARFDHSYYGDRYMPLLKARMGESCKAYAIDKGRCGRSAAAFVAMAHDCCESAEAFQNAFGPYAADLLVDIPTRAALQPRPRIGAGVVA